VSRRRQVNQPASSADEIRDPVDEDKVAQVIGAKLRLETIRRFAEGRGHLSH
jgi:hypothetical protein